MSDWLKPHKWLRNTAVFKDQNIVDFYPLRWRAWFWLQRQTLARWRRWFPGKAPRKMIVPASAQVNTDAFGSGFGLNSPETPAKLLAKFDVPKNAILRRNSSHVVDNHVSWPANSGRPCPEDHPQAVKDGPLKNTV